MSDIIYTPPASGGGGGITINPSDWAVPVRYNSNTFVDSGININQINGGVSFPQLNSDVGTSIISIGDVTGNYSNLFFSVDRANEIIYTQIQGNVIGLNLDFLSSIFAFGDFNSVSSGTSFYIDEGNSQMYTKHSSQTEGLYFDFVNDFFQIGDFASTNNGTFLTIDDDNLLIISYGNGNPIGLKLDFSNNAYRLGDFDNAINGTNFLIDDASQEMTFYTEFLKFVGTSLTDGATVIPSGRNLLVTINGAPYRIPLYKL